MQGGQNFKAFTSQAVQGRHALITYLICCHYPNNTARVTVIFQMTANPGYSNLFSPMTQCQLLFLALVSSPYVVSASHFRSLMDFFVLHEVSQPTGTFCRVESLLAFLSWSLKSGIKPHQTYTTASGYLSISWLSISLNTSVCSGIG